MLQLSQWQKRNKNYPAAKKPWQPHQVHIGVKCQHDITAVTDDWFNFTGNLPLLNCLSGFITKGSLNKFPLCQEKRKKVNNKESVSIILQQIPCLLVSLLHSLYGLYGPSCPLSPERPLNLITHTLVSLRFYNNICLKFGIFSYFCWCDSYILQNPPNLGPISTSVLPNERCYMCSLITRFTLARI